MPTNPACPHCGDVLVPVDTALRGTTAPWVSYGCRRGWWNAELTAAARGAWNKKTRSPGRNARAAIALERAQELRNQTEIRGN